MIEFGQAFAAAFRLIAGFDPGLVEIVGLSLRVSLSAVALAALVGLPLGAAVALYRFPGRLVIAATQKQDDVSRYRNQLQCQEDQHQVACPTTERKPSKRAQHQAEILGGLRTTGTPSEC